MMAHQPSRLVPKLRFTEFRDAPEWVQTHLADAFKKITNGHANAQDHQDDGAYPLFDRSEVTKRSSTFLFDAEVVILPGEGMRFQPRYFNGKFNLHQRAYALMEPTVDSRFAFHALDRFKEALADSAVQSTVLSLRMPIIERFEIPCPTSDDEQQKIADCLGSLDDLIASEDRKLDVLRQHKQGLMQRLFPQPGEVQPILRFPEFRGDPTWSAPQLSDLYRFKRTNTLSRDKLNYETGTIRNIHYGDIHTKFKPLFRVDEEHVPYVNPAASANGFNDGTFCEEGDIVLADASEDLDDVGKAIEVFSLDGERVVAGTHTILATRRGKVPVIGFGGQLFQSAAVRAGIKKEAQGAKVYGISANRISTIPIPIPPTVAEQQEIAKCFSELDTWIGAQLAKLDAFRTHKQGLLQQLFPSLDNNE